MKHFLVFAILVIVSDLAVGQRKLQVGIFYESLCPDSVNFIEYQLAPNYEAFADFIDIDFVPFGKSASELRGNGIGFTCQHGPRECEGNKIHSCALSALQHQSKRVEFVACQMSPSAELTGQSCADQAAIQFADIQTCAENGNGEQLQLDAEQKTRNVAYPNPMLRFVPTIVYNGKFDQAKQNRSQFDFAGVLCDELRAISDVLPTICQ